MSRRDLFFWVGLILGGAVCGAGIQKDLMLSRAEEEAKRLPTARKVAEIETRIVYLVDDLRVCKSAAPVVCTCETTNAHDARAEEQAKK